MPAHQPVHRHQAEVLPMAYAPVLGLEAYARSNNDKTTYELVKIRVAWTSG